MSSAIAVQVPAEDALAVRRFFGIYGVGAGARGFYLPFIAKECGLSGPRAMAALCALMELGEVEMKVHYLDLKFWPKGGSGE